MRLVLILATSFVAISSASAQGTISVTRPAGAGFSVTTGIGSSASVTTHPPDPAPAFTNKARIIGLFPYVPAPTEKKEDGARDLQRPALKPPARPSAYQAANTIGRDRIDSPHDAAFSKDNYFRQQQDRTPGRP